MGDMARTVLFFGLLYLFLWLVVKPCLIYSCGTITNFPIFYKGWAFFQDTVLHPGGLLKYVSALLSQLFYYSWAGAIVITAQAWAISACTGWFLRAVGMPGARWLRFVPALLILATYAQYTYHLPTIMGALAALLGACIYVSLVANRGIADCGLRIADSDRSSTPHSALRTPHSISPVIFAVLAVVLYVVSAAAFLPFAAMCALYELLHLRRYGIGLAYVVFGAIAPYIAGVVFFGVSIVDAYTDILPLSWQIRGWASRERMVGAVYALYLFPIAGALVGGLWRIIAESESATSSEPQCLTRERNAMSVNGSAMKSMPARIARVQVPVGWVQVLALLDVLWMTLGGIVLLVITSDGGSADARTRALVVFGVASSMVAIVDVVLNLKILYRGWAVIQDEYVRTTPGCAVGYLLIPLFNFYWIFVAWVGLAKGFNAFICRYRIPARQVSQGLFTMACILMLVGGAIVWIPVVGVLCALGTRITTLVVLWSVTRVVNDIHGYLTRVSGTKTDAGVIGLVGSLLVLATAGATAFVSLDGRQRTSLEVHYYACQRMWPEVLQAARRHPSDYFVMNAVNRALWHTGRFTQDMFSYPQHPDGLLHTGEDHVLAYWSKFDTQIDLGLMNVAEKNLVECMETFGEQPMILQRLAMVNMVKGSMDTARIYLGSLSKTLFYSRWAKDYLVRLETDPNLAGDRQIQDLRSRCLKKDQMALFYAKEEMLAALAGQDNRNRMAFEYLMAWYMQTKQMDKFVQNIGRLSEFGYTAIPPLYQEALVIYAYGKGKSVPLGGYAIDPEARRRIEDFSRIFNKYKRDKAAAFSELAASYRNSYLFYYVYAF
jgi:hypothetical protein